jgi:sugar lactone lactonase YvrE
LPCLPINRSHLRTSGLTEGVFNEIVVDGRGNTYFNGGDIVALIGRDGTVRKVAEGVAFPNGMAVTPDNGTLIVADSPGPRLLCLHALRSEW